MPGVSKNKEIIIVTNLTDVNANTPTNAEVKLRYLELSAISSAELKILTSPLVFMII